MCMMNNNGFKTKNLIIDCYNLILIAYSVANSFDNSEEALPNILTKMLKRLDKDFPFYNLYGCWDTPGGTAFRKNLCENYKVNRDSGRFNFELVQAMKSIFDRFYVRSIKVPECEADDAIFVLCSILKEKDHSCENIIVTRDKDLIQVVQKEYADNIWDVSKKCFMTIPSYSIVDFKSLVGDKSDGISGVPRIGEKTAIQVLSGFKQLSKEQQQIFENCKDIVDATRHPQFEEIKKYIEDLLDGRIQD